MIVSLYAPYPESGKDLVAQYLVDHYGFEKKKFANTLKQMLYILVRKFTDDPWYYLEVNKNDPIPNLGVTARYLMTTFGTDWGRNTIRKDLWAVIETKGVSSVEDFVFSDMRFVNEYRILEEKGAIMVKLIGRGNPDIIHKESERNLDNFYFHVILDNSGNVQYLWDQIEEKLIPYVTRRHH